MTAISFYKYHGAGNDCICIDNRAGQFLKKEEQKLIARLCHRNFGIGADGLILLEKHPAYDFEMIYYNADGARGSMCGNGGRCAVAFAHFLGIVKKQALFLAVDGPHPAVVERADWIQLKMNDVNDIEANTAFYFLDTGSPHYVTYVDDLATTDIISRGRSIRYNERFAKEGTNVNFIQSNGTALEIATYERGVENETLACGTGITAAAIVHHLQAGAPSPVAIKAKGGELSVSFEAKSGQFSNIWLNGPAVKVFEGQIEL